MITVTKSATELAVETAREALKEAMALHSATLPVCPDDKLAVLVNVTRKIDVTAGEVKLAKDVKDGFRFTEEHKDQIAAAKNEARILANTSEVRERLMADIKSGYIKSATRKLRADGRTVTTIKAVV